MTKKRKAPPSARVPNFNLLRPVSDLYVSVRSARCLQSTEAKFVGELVQRSEAEILKTKNFGRKSLNEIKEILHEMDLDFGMQIENFPPRADLDQWATTLAWKPIAEIRDDRDRAREEAQRSAKKCQDLSRALSDAKLQLAAMRAERAAGHIRWTAGDRRRIREAMRLLSQLDIEPEATDGTD